MHPKYVVNSSAAATNDVCNYSAHSLLITLKCFTDWVEVFCTFYIQEIIIESDLYVIGHSQH